MGMKTRAVIAAAVLAAGPLSLVNPPVHAATSVAVAAEACTGPVLFIANGGSWAFESGLADVCNDQLVQVHATCTYSGNSFSGTYYDNNCSGNVSGVIVATVAGTATLNGLLTSGKCGTSGGKVGTFSVSGADLNGVFAVTID